MIRYRLVCRKGHEFDGWFKNSASYDDQVAGKQLSCPHCASKSITKALMAPNVATRGPEPAQDAELMERQSPDTDNEFREVAKKIREHVERNADYVGTGFTEEARKIHYGETDPHGIYGEATPTQLKELIDEDIPIYPLPALPEDKS